jgi:hypothetical protein
MAAVALASATGIRLEEQQLNRQQHRGDRRVEGGRHAGCGPCYQQRLALGSGQAQVLGEKRANRPAGHDDRPFGAERAA